MKYCTHCGAETNEEAVICTRCGCLLGAPTASDVQQKVKMNVCALVGFILSMVSVVLLIFDFMGFLALAGMIVSIVGLTQIVSKKEQRGKGFAIAGVVVGACFYLFGLFLWVGIL